MKYFQRFDFLGGPIGENAKFQLITLFVWPILPVVLAKYLKQSSRGVLKKAVMKNFIKSIGKYLQWNSSSNKVAGLVLALQVFSPEFCGFFRIAILHSIPGWLHLHLWSKEEDGPIAVYCTIHQRNLTRSHMKRFLKHWNVMKKIGPSFSPFFD